MTHDILQTDIDLAIRLRDEQRPDEEIVTALVYRGVDPAKAAQFVDDIRNGRPAAIQPPPPPEFTATRRSRAKGRTEEGETKQPGLSAAPARGGKPQSHAAGRRRKKGALGRMVPVLIVLVAIAAAGVVLFQRYRAEHTRPDKLDGTLAGKQAAAPGESNAARRTAATVVRTPASLLLELQPEGLRISGRRVAASNMLQVVDGVLGSPSRTNRLGQTDTLVYAYDALGLLIYSPKAGGTNSIILDYEATGGTNGTTSPFAGALKIEDQVIGGDTDPRMLAGIAKLGLGKPKAGDTVWSGRYHDVDLVFAYLRTPGHLSLIEIDLK